MLGRTPRPGGDDRPDARQPDALGDLDRHLRVQHPPRTADASGHHPDRRLRCFDALARKGTRNTAPALGRGGQSGTGEF